MGNQTVGNNRNRIILLGIIGLVGLVIITAPLWTPYFINQEVDEAFPGLSSEASAVIREMPEEQQDVLLSMSAENPEMIEDTAMAMQEEDSEMTEVMPSGEPTALVMGNFNEFDAVHRGEGIATIYELADGSRVLRLEDFRVTNGPQLHVILTRTTPTSILEDVGEDYIDLGALSGNVGNQNYTIPEDVDISEYTTVVIYCVPFRVSFSAAELSTVQ